MRRALSLAISVCLFATACASAPVTAPPSLQPTPPSMARAALAVVVTNARTGIEVPQASVSLHTGETGATNDAGYVAWNDIEIGGRGITVRADGYHDKFFSLEAFTGNTQVPIALDPIAPPVIDAPITPPWTGQLRLARDGLGFQDADGRWVLPLCAHYGEAFSAFVHGKTIGAVGSQSALRGFGVEEQLRRIKAAGYDCIRFWDVLGYYDQNRPDQPVQWSAWAGAEVTPVAFTAYSGRRIPATPGYYEQLRDFISLLQRVGLAGFHSRGDLNGIPFDWVWAHTRNVAALYAERNAWSAVALAEANNENWQNGGFTPEQLRQLVEPFKAHRVLTAHSTAEQGEEPAAITEISAGASIYTVHGLRVGTFSQLLEHIFSLGYFSRVPDWPGVPRLGVQGEPSGPGEGVSVGRVNDRELLGLMAATSLISRQWWVYMSGHGVFWKGPIDSQPGFAVVPRIRRAIADFAADVMSWGLYHGGRHEAALRSPTGYEGDPGNANGPARIFNAVRPDRRAVVAVVEGGHGAKQLQNMLDCALQLDVISVNADESLTRHRVTLQPRASMAIDYAFGRLLLGVCQ